jgi:hypothetical protein
MSGQRAGCQPVGMFGALLRLIGLRLLGARIMLGLAIFGWVRRLFSKERDRQQSRRDQRQARARSRGAYQPSQGESQIVQREPR